MRLFIAVGALALTACMKPTSTPKAAQTLSCDEDDIQTSAVGPIRITSGCGKKDVIVHDPTKDDWVSLRERAAFDLTCDMATLEIAEVGDTKFGVSGCGQTALYKFVPTSGFVREAKPHLEPEGAEAPAAAE